LTFTANRKSFPSWEAVELEFQLTQLTSFRCKLRCPFKRQWKYILMAAAKSRGAQSRLLYLYAVIDARLINLYDGPDPSVAQRCVSGASVGLASGTLGKADLLNACDSCHGDGHQSADVHPKRQSVDGDED
jgi:hypothetical protein